MEEDFVSLCACPQGPKATRQLVPFPVEAGEVRYTVGVYGFVCAVCEELLGLEEDKIHIGLVLP